MTISHENLPLTLEAERPFALTPAPTVSGPAAVLALMAQAVEKGMAVDTMESLQAMYHKEQDRAAAREFADAMARFQETCPAIPKNASTATVGERSGAKFSFTYAPLDTIAATVGPHLHKLGLTYSWDTEAGDKGLICTCTLRHRNGHSVSARFACPTDSSLAVGSQQKFGAALTYARRYSLIQVLGLTTTDPDADQVASEPIGPNQEALLDALIQEVGADKPRLLKWLGVAALADLPAAEYARAVNGLEDKRKKGKA